jgi:hypothetical protein
MLRKLGCALAAALVCSVGQSKEVLSDFFELWLYNLQISGSHAPPRAAQHTELLAGFHVPTPCARAFAFLYSSGARRLRCSARQSENNAS